MSDYADETIKLFIRIEQMARTGDKALAKALQELQNDLLNKMVKAGIIPSRKKMSKVRIAIAKAAAGKFKTIRTIMGEYSETAAEAAVTVEKSNFFDLGADAHNAVGDIAVSGVVERSLDRNLPGLPSGRQVSIGDMVEKMVSGGTAAVSNIANKSFIEGLSVDQAARELRKALEITNSQAKTVMRTQMLGAANQARDEVAENFEISKEMWLATLDNKTCPFCAGRDGACHDPGKLPKPPAHPNCRCTILYIPEGTSCKEIKNDMYRPSRGPDGKSTRNTKYKDYGEWLKTQPKDFQIEILGKERYRLLQSGKVSFKQMYLRNGSRKTITQIRKQYKIPKPKPLPKVSNKTARTDIPKSLNEYGINYKGSSLDPMVKNEVEKFISKMGQEYPETMNLVREIREERISGGGMEFDNGDYSILVDKRNYSTATNIKNMGGTGKASDGLPYVVSGDRVDVTFAHEFGHATQRSIYNQLNNIEGASDFFQKSLKDIFIKAKKPSNYAKKNHREMVSEAFAEKYAGGELAESSVLVFRLLNELIEKYGVIL